MRYALVYDPPDLCALCASVVKLSCPTNSEHFFRPIS